MAFNQVIAQAPIKEQLVQMVEQNRLSHALLFLGKEGSGALSLAIAFAQYVVCNPTPLAAAASLFGEESKKLAEKNNDSCGQCGSCIKAATFIHPDIHFSYPVVPRKSGDKPLSTDYIAEWREFIKLNPYGNAYDWLQYIGAENKQGNISAHECNDILRKLSLKSFEGAYKILVMWLPEYLGKEGNKLLKLIEEPPANTLFILVAENEEEILPTILSRTQLVRVPQLSKLQVEEALISRANMEPNPAKQLAAISEGNYREALQLMQHAETDWQVVLRDWLNCTIKYNTMEQVKWVDEMAKIGREKQKQFLQYFIHLLEQSIKLAYMPSMANTIAEGEKDFAERLNKFTYVHQQEAIVVELGQAIYFIERNANGKMLFQALTIKLHHIIKNNAIIDV